jgi:hypothetical protein
MQGTRKDSAHSPALRQVALANPRAEADRWATGRPPRQLPGGRQLTRPKIQIHPICAPQPEAVSRLTTVQIGGYACGRSHKGNNAQ